MTRDYRKGANRPSGQKTYFAPLPKREKIGVPRLKLKKSRRDQEAQEAKTNLQRLGILPPEPRESKKGDSQ